MRRLLMIPVLACALLLPGCAGGDIRNLLTIATSSIDNPVDRVDIYRIKNAYAASLELIVQFRRYCWSKSYATLMADPIAKPVCQNRRTVVRAVNLHGPRAETAIQIAEDFVRDNPTLNASKVLGLAWTAVTKLQNSLPSVQ